MQVIVQKYARLALQAILKKKKCKSRSKQNASHCSKTQVIVAFCLDVTNIDQKIKTIEKCKSSIKETQAINQANPIQSKVMERTKNTFMLYIYCINSYVLNENY